MEIFLGPASRGVSISSHWFVANDLCRLVGYSNVAFAFRSICFVRTQLVIRNDYVQLRETGF